MSSENQTFSMPLPCSKPWSEMTPAEGGRVCDSCDHLVYDFRNESPERVFQVWKERKGKVCGVFNQSQINRPFGRFGLARFLVVAIAVFGSFLFSVSSAEARQLREMLDPPQEVRAENEFQIRGVLTDQETGELIIGAKVRVKDQPVGTLADLDGKYSLKVTEENFVDGELTLVFSMIGYQDIEVQFQLEEMKEVMNIDLEFKSAEGFITIGIIIEGPLETGRETEINVIDDPN